MTFRLIGRTDINTAEIPCCVCGEVIELEMIRDNIFSSKILGEGYGVIPSAKEITSPFDCVVRDITNGGQTLSLKCENGLQLLIHIGIDLPEANSSAENELYRLAVGKGDMLSAGDMLGEIFFDRAAEKGFDPTVVLIITNSDDIEGFSVCKGVKSIEDAAAQYTVK